MKKLLMLAVAGLVGKGWDMKSRIYWYLITGLIIAGFIQWAYWTALVFIPQEVDQKYFAKNSEWLQFKDGELMFAREGCAVNKKGWPVRLVNYYKLEETHR